MRKLLILLDVSGGVMIFIVAVFRSRFDATSGLGLVGVGALLLVPGFYFFCKENAQRKEGTDLFWLAHFIGLTSMATMCILGAVISMLR